MDDDSAQDKENVDPSPLITEIALHNAPFTVFVEGNIGCGKSTFLKYIEQKCDTVEVLPEPVESWKNFKGVNLLGLMYEDPKRWSAVYQSYVQLTMLQLHDKPTQRRVKLIERSVLSARYCFVENHHQKDRISPFDFAVHDQWFDWAKSTGRLQCDLIVYLRAKPETCLQRMQKRNRSEESPVPLEYLQDVHEHHDDWLLRKKFGNLHCPLLLIDADQPFEELQRIIDKHLPIITFANFKDALCA